MPIAKPPTEPRLSESDVQAFADGMLDPTRAASVETYLKSRPDEADRVAFYGRLNWQMQNAFHEADDEEALQAAALRGVCRDAAFARCLPLRSRRWHSPPRLSLHSTFPIQRSTMPP